MSYPKKFREAVLAFHEDGHTIKETSDLFKVSACAIKNWKKLLREKGSLEIQKRNRPFKKIDPEQLREYVREHPDAYQSEMAKEFKCSARAIGKALARLKITRKKRSNAIRNKIRKK